MKRLMSKAMRVWRWPRSGILAFALALTMLGSTASPVAAGPYQAELAGPTLADEVAAARHRAADGDAASAIALAERALARAEHEEGPESRPVAIILSDLARFQVQQGQPDIAERYLRRTVAIMRDHDGSGLEFAIFSGELARLLADRGALNEALGHAEAAYHAFAAIDPAAPDTATAEAALAILLVEFGRLPEAEHHLRTADRILATMPEERGSVRLNLAIVLASRGQIDDAAKLASETLTHAERTVGRDTDLWRQARYTVALVAITDGRLREGEKALTELLADLPEAQRDSAPLAAYIFYMRGHALGMRGLYVEAEAALRRSEEIFSRQIGGRHPMRGRVLHNLAVVHLALGNLDRARGLFDRAIAIQAAVLGEDAEPVLATTVERALIDIRTGQADAAEQRARSVQTALGLPDAAAVESKAIPPKRLRLLGFAQIVLGLAARQRDEPERAIAAFETAVDRLSLAQREQAAELYLPLIELGALYTAAGRFAAAEAALDRAILILERDQAAVPTKLGRALKAKAELRLAQGRETDALDLLRRGTKMLEARAVATIGTYSELGMREQESEEARAIYAAHVAVAYGIYARGSNSAEGRLAEAFLAAQGAQISSVSAIVNQMAARFGNATGALGQAIRDYQDTLSQWRQTQQKLYDLMAGASDPAAEQTLHSRLARLERDIRVRERQLADQFPRYAELTNPRPVELTAVQALLRPDEAVVLILTDEAATYTWVISRSGAAAVRSEAGRVEIEHLVHRIRATLDLAAAGRILQPFAAADAYRLFDLTLGLLAGRLDGIRHLIWVADGALLSLPPGVLLQQPVAVRPGDVAQYQTFPWLGLRFAVSVLPSVSALGALRSLGLAVMAPEPFLGIGNPKLKGGVTRRRAEDVFPEGLRIDYLALRSLHPLPETAEELRRMRVALGGHEDDLLFEQEATVHIVWSLPLANYRVIAFATHALMVGEFRGLAEPALVLTPPDEPSEDDTGLLRASDIARLRLNADWIILSACNTAAPDGTPGATGLSGLAGAFLYAGARALLVSHWKVGTDAAVALTTGAIERLAAAPTIGKAEALRQAMSAMLAGPDPEWMAHPAFWAPFVLVGDGGGP